MYLVASRAPSPRTVVCVCVPCVLFKAEWWHAWWGGRWLSRDHLYLCRPPPPPGLKLGHWSSPSGPPIACSLPEPDWQHWETSRRHLPGYCFLIGNGVSSVWEWVECDPGILFLLLEMETELLHAHLWKEVQRCPLSGCAYCPDWLIALASCHTFSSLKFRPRVRTCQG